MSGQFVRAICVLLLWCACGCAEEPQAAHVPTRFEHAHVVHLPGIAGEAAVDHAMIRGLRDAGYEGATEIYDWTDNDPGLGALLARKRNEGQAEHIAAHIVEIVRHDPEAKIILISHSGGTGLAVWTLEKLPPNVKVESLLLLSSALSPQYDLSEALRHVRGSACAFNSQYDTLVLGTGTRLFGTIDGVKCTSAGQCGFVAPEASGDTAAYGKLVQYPYDRTWMNYGNAGDHIGTLSRQFSQHVLAPLVFDAVDGTHLAHGPLTQPAAVTNNGSDTGRPSTTTTTTATTSARS